MGLDEDTSPGLFVGPKAKDGIAYDLWQTQSKLFKLRKDYLKHWQKTDHQTGTGRPVDAIICPASASVAVPHGKNLYVTTFAARRNVCVAEREAGTRTTPLFGMPLTTLQRSSPLLRLTRLLTSRRYPTHSTVPSIRHTTRCVRCGSAFDGCILNPRYV